MILSMYSGVWWLSVRSKTKSGWSIMTSHQLFRACTFTYDLDNFKVIKIISRCSEIITLMDTYRTDLIIRELLEKYLKLSKRTDINLNDSIPVSIINDDILIVVKFGY